ncbi:MAG: PQQ-binding-like beta-propeller repeat protein [Methanobacteriota archaeon]
MLRKPVYHLVFGLLIGLVLCTLFIPVTGEITYESLNKNIWWSMHHHDLSNTGFSPSKAPDTNTLFWVNSTGDRIFSSPAVVSSRLYVGSDDTYMYCMNANTGQRLWRYSVGSMVRSSPTVGQGKVFFGADNGIVYCLRANDGSFFWSYQTLSWWIYSSPVLTNDRVYIGGQDGRVYCLDANPDDNGDGVINWMDSDEGYNDPEGVTYDLIWWYQTGYWVDATPAVAQERIFVGSYDGFMYCLNAQNGGFIWSYDTSSYLTGEIHDEDEEPLIYQRYIASSASIYKQNVIFSTTDGMVFCLNTTDGSLKWKTQAGLGGDRTSPAVAYGRVYIGSYIIEMQPPYPHYGKLFCLDVNTGQQLWNYTVESTVHFCSVADHKVYFGISNFWVEPDYLYCLNATSGMFIWRYEVGDYLMSTPVLACNSVYVTSCDGNLYCFRGHE